MSSVGQTVWRSPLSPDLLACPWWSHFGRDAQAYVVVARDDQGTIRGLLPLYRCDGGSGGRILAVMGDGEACSDHVSVLAREDGTSQVADQIGRHLACDGKLQQVGLGQIDIDGVVEG